MILRKIDSLKRAMPAAFEVRPEDIRGNSVESKHYHETIPFKRDISVDVKLQLYPADTFQITQYNRPQLELDSVLDEESKELGTEALVWYKPFHSYDAKWGIYVRWRGVLYTAYSLYRAGYSDSDAEILTASLIKNAFRILHAHAYFHFLVEWAASFIESLYGKPLYNLYVGSIMRGEIGREWNIEESLANTYAQRQVEPRVKEALTRLYRLQPSPYREIDPYVDEEGYVLGTRRLGLCLHALACEDLSAKAREDDLSEEPQWEGIFNVEPRQASVWEVPIYWVAEPEPTSNVPQVIQLLLSSYKDRVDSLKRTLGQALKPSTQKRDY